MECPSKMLQRRIILFSLMSTSALKPQNLTALKSISCSLERFFASDAISIFADNPQFLVGALLMKRHLSLRPV